MQYIYIVSINIMDKLVGVDMAEFASHVVGVTNPRHPINQEAD